MSGKRKTSARMEKQNIIAETMYDESTETRQDDIRRSVRKKLYFLIVSSLFFAVNYRYSLDIAKKAQFI